MIALMLASMALPSDPVVVSEEIVVLSRKLSTWKGKTKSDATGVRCKTSRTSGDRDVDALACESVVTCMTRLTPKVAAIQQAKQPRAQTETAMAQVNKDLVACLTAEHDRRTAELADRRFQARQAR